jgi:hypothetical protein
VFALALRRALLLLLRPSRRRRRRRRRREESGANEREIDEGVRAYVHDAVQSVPVNE